VVDRGVRCSNTPVPANLNACAAIWVPAPAVDVDGGFRPNLSSTRFTTPWDLGADERPGVPLPLPLLSLNVRRPK
jgi:hypothetical protein